LLTEEVSRACGARLIADELPRPHDATAFYQGSRQADGLILATSRIVAMLRVTTFNEYIAILIDTMHD
jgi:hypothetical protein